MSADLFAEFGSVGQSMKATPNDQVRPAGGPNGLKASEDPFGLSGFGIQTQPQVAQSTNFSPSRFQQWSSPPAPAPAPATALGLASNSSPWDDLSFLGGSPAPTAVAQTGQSLAEDDDGWGDFETAEPVSQPSSKSGLPAQAQAAIMPASAVPRRTRIVRASTFDIMTNNLLDLHASPDPNPGPEPAWTRPAPPQPSQPKPPARAQDPNVLFDADNFDPDDDEDEEDEFGEFETVETQAPPTAVSSAYQSDRVSTALPASKPASQPPSMDLLSLDDFTMATEPAPALTKQPEQPPPLSFGAIGAASSSRSPAQRPSTPEEKRPPLNAETPWPDMDKARRQQESVDDGWGSFDSPPNKGAGQAASAQLSTWDWETVESFKPDAIVTRDDEPPPINVPPPSILLSVFPASLDLANSSLYSPLAGKAGTTRQRVLSDPNTIEFLKAYLLLSTVAARIIAGRKHRWNRDKILAKAMSISTAGSKGMKLAGVDKSQAARDDREAADVVMVWKEHVGKLRSAVAAANSVMAGGVPKLQVPELAETMAVHPAKMVPTAPKPCVVCGLKRDERVSGVDRDVEDSFGEWWVEHWGHRACKNFWLEHEKQLRQR